MAGNLLRHLGEKRQIDKVSLWIIFLDKYRNSFALDVVRWIEPEIVAMEYMNF